MMSIGTIERMNKEAEERAKENEKYPIGVFDGDKLNTEKLRSIPYIGDWRPDGFELVKEHFVDSSGFGSPGEFALTFNQFCDVVKPNRYYAIIEQGQFQVYIGEFKRL